MPLARSLVALLLAAALAACETSNVGAPCLPGRPDAAANEPQCAPGAGCFSGSEVYIETTSLQCRTRVCLAYHWDERSAPQERSMRVGCTCRCAGDVDPGTLCDCPEGYACTTVFETGNPGLRGSYCVDERVPRQ